MGPAQTLKIALSSILILSFNLRHLVHEGFPYQVLQLKRTTNFSFLKKIVCPVYLMSPSFINVYLVEVMNYEVSF